MEPLVYHFYTMYLQDDPSISQKTLSIYSDLSYIMFYGNPILKSQYCIQVCTPVDLRVKEVKSSYIVDGSSPMSLLYFDPNQ